MTIGVRVTDRELSAIDRAAAADDRRVTEWVRHLIARELGRLGLAVQR